MQAVFLSVLLFILSIFYLDAFIPSPRPGWQLQQRQKSVGTRCLHRNILSSFHVASSSSDNDDRTTTGMISSSLTHANILWKLRPPPETSVWKRLWLRFAANVIRLDCIISRRDPPIALCPKGGKAVLEAYCRDDVSGKVEKVGRFGFTTQRGPPAQPFQDTVNDIYDIPSNIMVGVAAIVYMYVEPNYRKREIGSLALDVISLIHAIQGCDFTVLVVDDDGSGKLIDWYLRHGYSRAPKLQDILGSPNAVNGITMIAPTKRILPDDCKIQWW